jgi:hypothetical protein
MPFDKKEYSKQYTQNNKEYKKEYSKMWRERNGNTLYDKDYQKQYQEQNKEKVYNTHNKYVRERKQTDPLFKLRVNIYSTISKSLLKNNYRKSSSTQDILGCTFKELKQHLESQFEPWMNWDNRAGRLVKELNTVWDIDHIIPLNSAQTEEDIIRLNHYTNLRPICAYYNRWVKRDKAE